MSNLKRSLDSVQHNFSDNLGIIRELVRVE